MCLQAYIDLMNVVLECIENKKDYEPLNVIRNFDLKMMGS